MSANLNTETLASVLRQFEAALPYGADLRACLEAAGSRFETLSRVPAQADAWMGRIALGEALSERFRATHAFLAAGPGITERSVIQALVASSEGFDTPSIFVTLHDDDGIAGYVASPLLHHEAQHVRWWWLDDFEALDGSSSGECNQWVYTLQASLRLDDVFEQRNPIHVSDDTTKRRWDLSNDLARAIERGESLGCFGLRKVGKTSTLLSSRRSIESGSKIAGHHERVAWVDLQGLTTRTLHGLCASVLGALGDDRADASIEALDAALTERSEKGRPSWIVLDEYDLLFANAHGRGGVEGVERFFSLLRAHAQRSKQVSLVVIGRDPSHAQRSTMEGAPNPLLGWLSTRWIGPLDEGDARALFVKLARRVCLDADEPTLDAALRWTGGHPMLLRQFGSALLSVARPREDALAPLSSGAFVEQAIDAFLERDAVLEMCREVEHALSTVYPDAASTLWQLVGRDSSRDLSEGSRVPLERLGGWRTPAARTLRNLGLLQGTEDEPGIPELWRWWSSYVTWRPSVNAG